MFKATGEKDAILFKTVLIRPTICVCHSTIETSGAHTIKLFDPSNLQGATILSVMTLSIKGLYVTLRINNT